MFDEVQFGAKSVLPSLPDPMFKAWVDPVSEASPCGEEIGFSDEFESLREEVEKSVSLHRGRGTDWPLVLRMATQLLATRSKDLWVLCYGVMAAYETQGTMCCAAALSALSSLLESFWADLHPSPVRAQRRIAAFKWLAGRLEARVSPAAMAKEKAAAHALKEELARLQTILDIRFADAAPSFSALLRLPEDAPRDAHPNDPDQARRTKDISGPSASRPASVSSVDEILTAIDGDGRVPAAVLPRLFRSTQDQCRQLAAHFGSGDPVDWRVILLHRTALWCTVDQLPPADTACVTQLRPVPPEKALAYSTEVEAGRFRDVLPRLEVSAGKAPFWLDGHRLVACCLEGMGASGALSVLRTVLVQFLCRFPELPRYKFQDGTPFASPRTLQWLDSLESPLATRPSSRSNSGGGEAALEQELLDAGLAIRAERGFQAGLSHLERVPAGRSRAAVRQGLLLARYCVAAGNKKAAVRLLQSLYGQLEKWELLDWEPELSAAIISLLLSLQPKERGAGAEMMLSRLHWLHLGSAVGSSKGA